MFETLYHKGKAGTLYSWEITVEDDEIVTTYGLVDGQKQVARKRAYPKNVGKKNETSGAAQALAEAASMHKFKLDRKYSLNPDEAEEPLELPMLAHDFGKVKKIAYPLDMQPKLDGVRCIAKWVDGVVVLMSRSGKPFLIPHLSDAIASFLPKKKKLDGEIYKHGLTFQEILTLVKRPREESTQLEFHVYDCMDEDEDQLTWSDRYKDLCATLGLALELGPVSLVPTWTANSPEEKDEIYVRCIEAGYEGAIARLHTGLYLYGYRSRELLKIKDFADAEFPIVDAYEGVGKFEGCITWVCVTEKGQRFSACPKGTLEEKREAWQAWQANPKEFEGKSYKVKFFELTDDGIPRFPIGLGFRLPEDMSNPENGED